MFLQQFPERVAPSGRQAARACCVTPDRCAVLLCSTLQHSTAAFWAYPSGVFFVLRFHIIHFLSLPTLLIITMYFLRNFIRFEFTSMLRCFFYLFLFLLLLMMSFLFVFLLFLLLLLLKVLQTDLCFKPLLPPKLVVWHLFLLANLNGLHWSIPLV